MLRPDYASVDRRLCAPDRSTVVDARFDSNSRNYDRISTCNMGSASSVDPMLHLVVFRRFCVRFAPTACPRTHRGSVSCSAVATQRREIYNGQLWRRP